MNYELAKQLKDAEYPQLLGNYLKEDDSVQIYKDEHNLYPSRGSLVYSPTLSELIEACGEGWFSLRKEGEVWRAEHPHKTLRLIIIGEDFTPEEAVARLWLELQK